MFPVRRKRTASTPAATSTGSYSLPTSPVAGKFSARGACGPVLGPARYRPAGWPTGRRPVRYEGGPTGRMAEGRQPVPVAHF